MKNKTIKLQGKGLTWQPFTTWIIKKLFQVEVGVSRQKSLGTAGVTHFKN